MAPKKKSLAELAKYNGWTDANGNDFPNDITWDDLAANLKWDEMVYEGALDNFCQKNIGYSSEAEAKGIDFKNSRTTKSFAEADKILQRIYGKIPTKEVANPNDVNTTITILDLDAITVRDFTQVIQNIIIGYGLMNKAAKTQNETEFNADTRMRYQVMTTTETENIAKPLYEILDNYQKEADEYVSRKLVGVSIKDLDEKATLLYSELKDKPVSEMMTAEDIIRVKDTVHDLESRLYRGGVRSEAFTGDGVYQPPKPNMKANQ